MKKRILSLLTVICIFAALLTENRQALEDVARYLLEHETMDRKEFLAVFGETEGEPAAAPAEIE